MHPFHSRANKSVTGKSFGLKQDNSISNLVSHKHSGSLGVFSPISSKRSNMKYQYLPTPISPEYIPNQTTTMSSTQKSDRSRLVTTDEYFSSLICKEEGIKPSATQRPMNYVKEFIKTIRDESKTSLVKTEKKEINFQKKMLKFKKKEVVFSCDFTNTKDDLRNLASDVKYKSRKPEIAQQTATILEDKRNKILQVKEARMNNKFMIEKPRILVKDTESCITIPSLVKNPKSPNADVLNSYMNDLNTEITSLGIIKTSGLANRYDGIDTLHLLENRATKKNIDTDKFSQLATSAKKSELVKRFSQSATIFSKQSKIFKNKY